MVRIVQTGQRDRTPLLSRGHDAPGLSPPGSSCRVARAPQAPHLVLPHERLMCALQMDEVMRSVSED
jgi:hypothetical protein